MTSRRLLAAGACCLPLAATAAEHRVIIDGMSFRPQVIEAAPGDTIVWENRDMFTHNVTAAAPHVASGNLAPGAHWRYVVRTNGSFDYRCTLHPVMTGRVEVADPAPRHVVPRDRPRFSRGGGTPPSE